MVNFIRILREYPNYALVPVKQHIDFFKSQKHVEVVQKPSAVMHVKKKHWLFKLCLSGSISSCDAFLNVFQTKGLKPEVICPCASSPEALTVAIRRYTHAHTHVHIFMCHLKNMSFYWCVHKLNITRHSQKFSKFRKRPKSSVFFIFNAQF